MGQEEKGSLFSLSIDRSFSGVKPLPPPKRLAEILGPGAIISAMAIGAGELIFWPILVANHGFSIAWLIPIALFVQYLWLVESARWTIAVGEGWVQASGRLPARMLWPVLWVFIMTVTLVWPGWAIASAVALWMFTGGDSSFLGLVGWGLVVYLSAAFILLAPKRVYTGLHYVSLAAIIVFNVGLIASAIGVATSNPATLGDAIRGFTSFGKIPEGVDMRLLASAIAYAGLGAMGNAFYSLLVRDRGWGMASYAGSIPGLRGKGKILEKGYMPNSDPQDLSRLRGWSRLLEKEGLALFLIPSFLTLFLFVYLAGAILYPRIVSGEISPEKLQGLGAVLIQSKFFETLIGDLGVTIYLIVAFMALWTTQLGLLDAMSRTWADTLYVYSSRARKVGVKTLYVAVLAILVVIGISVIVSGAWKTRPADLLKLAAYLGLIQQIISIPVTVAINHFILPKEIKEAMGVRTWKSLLLLSVGVTLYLFAFIGGL